MVGQRRVCGGWVRGVGAWVAACAGVLAGGGGCALQNAGRYPDPRDAASGGTADAHVAAGQEASASGDKERALAEFTRAIEINPRLTAAHMGIADIYRLEGEYGKAEAGYRRAADIEPRNFDAQYHHGLMLHLLNRLTEAVAAYLRALTIKPDDFQANLNVASAYFQLGENAQALPYAQRAVVLDPQSGPARFNLGATYAALQRHREAVVEYQQAAEVMELTPPLLLSLAESQGKLGRYGEMRNTLEPLVASAPSAAACERLGYAMFKLREYEGSLRMFEQALGLDESYEPALNGAGVCLLNFWVWSDKRDMALRDRGLAMLRRSLRVNPDQPRILELLTRYETRR